MNAEKYLRALLIPTLVAGLVLPAMFAAEGPAPAAENQKTTYGAIVGVIRNAAKAPIAGATVTSAKVDGSGLRATISSSEGIYSFADVIPGEYSVSSQADGYLDTAISRVEVTPGKATRSDIVIATSGPVQPVVISSNSTPRPPAPVASANPAPTANNAAQGTWSRWLKVMAAPVKPAPSTTASLKAPPATAFDRPIVDTPDVPFPAPQPAPAAPAPPARVVPEALSAPDPGPPGVDNDTPFAFGDFTWMNGASRNKDTVLDTKYFTPEIRFDTNYIIDFNQPVDHTMGGSTEEFRNGEFQVEDIGIGGDFHWQNVRGRIMIMDGLFAVTTPRNDASSATGSAAGNTGGVGQWDLQNAYKYVSEAYGGYHFNVQHGLNIDAGIFVSYVGLFSYYNFDNWTYQPSYVSSNTPWFFQGVRTQWFPTNKLKIEPWVVNGWQSYAKYNSHLGLGGQLLWEPKDWFKFVGNQYGYGEDNLGLKNTQRIHTDDSVVVKFYDNQNNGAGISKGAISFTADAGCQYGGGVTCHGGPNKSSFLGWMEYNRVWWDHDKFAMTLGGGQMSNTGRYLTLLPPIDGAWAASGSAYFTENPGQTAKMWDSTLTFHYMPKQYITWWAEAGYRHSNVPYFSGREGITPPGGNNGAPQYYACSSGASSGTASLAAAEAACGGGSSSVWFPDLRRSTSSLGFGVMVKF